MKKDFLKRMRQSERKIKIGGLSKGLIAVAGLFLSLQLLAFTAYGDICEILEDYPDYLCDYDYDTAVACGLGGVGVWLCL